MDFGDALAAEVRCWSLRAKTPGCQHSTFQGTRIGAQNVLSSDGSDGSDCVIGQGQEGEANISVTLSGRDVAVVKPQFS